MTLREKIITCLGKFPQKAPLEFSIDSETVENGYTKQKVSYNVEPGERVNAYLLIPDDISAQGKLPGILAIHQHAGQWHIGKSEVTGDVWEIEEGMYAYGRDLVKRGYVVLCPDILSFEERIPEAFRNGEDGGALYERFAFTKRVQEGSCLQTKCLHDLSTALDVLCSLDFVDENRIGAVGHSMGGQSAVWITWYDERIKAGISSCGFGKVQTIFRDYVNHNFSLYVPGMANVCDMEGVLCGIAPRAFAMTSGVEDKIFPIDGVREIVSKAEKTYTDLGISDRFLADIFDDGHCFGQAQKDKLYPWLDLMLGKK